jgi:hypothetical protein
MVEIGERMHTKQAIHVSDVDVVPYCKAHRRSKEPKEEKEGGVGHLCLVRLSARVNFSKVIEPAS